MDAEAVREYLAAFGPIDVRRMFGGFGLYANGVMFGIVAFDAIHLRADDLTIPDFTAEGCQPFSYTRQQTTIESRRLWKISERLYDDPDELAVWARKACAAAVRISLNKASPAKRKSSRPAKAAKSSPNKSTRDEPSRSKRSQRKSSRNKSSRKKAAASARAKKSGVEIKKSRTPSKARKAQPSRVKRKTRD